MSSRIGSSIIPILTIVLSIVVLWYAFAVYLNMPWERSVAQRAGTNPTIMSMASNTMQQERPVLPAPHQVVEEVINTTIKKDITSKRSLVFHAGITLSSSMLGFLMGTLLGILLAIAIVYSNALSKSLMP